MMGKIGDVCLGNERKTSSSLLVQKLNQKNNRKMWRRERDFEMESMDLEGHTKCIRQVEVYNVKSLKQ